MPVFHNVVMSASFSVYCKKCGMPLESNFRLRKKTFERRGLLVYDMEAHICDARDIKSHIKSLKKKKEKKRKRHNDE